jgi:hypothetical protein
MVTESGPIDGLRATRPKVVAPTADGPSLQTLLARLDVPAMLDRLTATHQTARNAQDRGFSGARRFAAWVPWLTQCCRALVRRAGLVRLAVARRRVDLGGVAGGPLDGENRFEAHGTATLRRRAGRRNGGNPQSIARKSCERDRTPSFA